MKIVIHNTVQNSRRRIFTHRREFWYGTF